MRKTATPAATAPHGAQAGTRRAPTRPGAATTVEVELQAALLLATDAMRALFFSRLRQLDLSPPQAHTLRLLDEPLPMGNLAESLQCDASNMTGIADRLEERGLVERRLDPHDRRVKLLALTAAGRRVRDELSRSFVSELPGLHRLDHDEQRQLARLLVKAFS